MGHDWGDARRRGGLERAALAVAGPRRHELRAARGARRHPVAVLRRGRTPASCSSTAGCGRTRSPGRRAPFVAVEHDPPVDKLDDDFPIRLTTGRRLDSYNTGVQTGGYTLAAAPRRVARPLARGRRARYGLADGERVRVISRRGAVEAPVRIDHVAAPRARVHDAPLPGRGRDEPADHRRHRPEVRHGRVQGDGDPGREARRRPSPRTAPSVAGAGDAVARAADGPPSCTDDEPSAAERDAVDAVLGPPAVGWEGGAPRRRDAPRRARRARGARAAPPAAAGAPRGPGARRLDQPAARSTTSAGGSRSRRPRPTAWPRFYALFALEPRPPVVAHVCADIACMCRGGAELVAELERTVGPAGEHPANGRLDLAARARASACASGRRRRWSRAPASRRARRRRRPGERADVVAALLAGGDAPAPSRRRACRRPASPALRLLRRDRPRRPDEPRQLPRRTAATRRCARAFEHGPGRRDPRGHRRRSCSAAAARRSRPAASGRPSPRNPARPHYLVCNADESEPGTFKDRVLIESDPFALVEAMTIAGLRDRLRARLPLPPRRVPAGLGAARRRDRPRRGRAASSATTSWARASRFDIELRKGAGAYICGEETALFNSIEGYRGEPRNKPPFPVEVGPVRQADGRQQRRDAGQRARHRARGRRGVRQDRHRAVDRHAAVLPVRAASSGPGVYEAPFGVTLRELLELAGGVAGGGTLQAVLLGGAAGGFVGARRARPRADVRGDARGRRDAGLGRGHGRSTTPSTCRADPAADRRVLPRRVVRPVRALPGRHRPPGGGARCASSTERPRGHASRTSSRCSTRSRGRCATRRSAASARRPPTPSSRRCSKLRRLRDRRSAA